MMIRLPGVCIDCRRHVTWNGKRWLDSPVGRGTGRRHECLATAAPKAHNQSVGVSDTPIDESARFPLTPVAAGSTHPRAE